MGKEVIKSFDLSIRQLFHRKKIDVVTFNVLRENNLNKLSDIYKHYLINKDFLQLNNIGINSNNQLIAYLSSNKDLLSHLIRNESRFISEKIETDDDESRITPKKIETNEDETCLTPNNIETDEDETGSTSEIIESGDNEIILNLKINDFEKYDLLSVRAKNVLRSESIHTLKDLFSFYYVYGTFILIRNCGCKANMEIIEYIKYLKSEIVSLTDENLNSYFTNDFSVFKESFYAEFKIRLCLIVKFQMNFTKAG